MRDGVIVTPPQTAGDPRRHQPQVDHPDRARPRASRSSSATSRAPSCTWPTRSSSPAPPPSWCRSARSTTTRSATGKPGEITQRRADRLRGRPLRPDRALPRVARSRAGALRRVAMIELYDATLRDGMQGEGLSLTAAEKLRVAHRLDELGVHLIEAGFPSSNPKEIELFGLLAARARSRHAQIAAFGMTRRRDVTADADPAPAGPGRLLRAGLHDRGQDVGPAPREGRPRRPRGEPRDDRGVGRVPRRPGQARHLRRRALLRRLARRPRLRAALPARRRATPAPSASSCATPTARRCPTRSREATARRRAPALGRTPRSASTATTTPTCGVANSLAAVEAGATQVQGTMNGVGERTRQREPRLDHRQPAAQARPRGAAGRAARDA